VAETRGVDHAGHDLERIARVAAGDGSVTDDRAAAELRAECAECARLDADLRAIATGLRELGGSSSVAPAPRDFRLTAADAARLRPAGLRGLLQGLWIGGVGVAARSRIGSGLVAIGIIGVLIGSGLPGGSTAGGPAFGAIGAASGPETNDVKTAASAPAVFAPLQSRLDQAAPPTDQTRGAAVDAGGSPAVAWGPALLALSIATILAGFGLLLAALGGRRAGP